MKNTEIKEIIVGSAIVSTALTSTIVAIGMYALLKKNYII